MSQLQRAPSSNQPLARMYSSFTENGDTGALPDDMLCCICAFLPEMEDKVISKHFFFDRAVF